jgi:hypothetical protein
MIHWLTRDAIDKHRQLPGLEHLPRAKEINLRHNHPKAVSELAISHLAAHLSGIMFSTRLLSSTKNPGTCPNPNSDDFGAFANAIRRMSTVHPCSAN